MRKFQAVLVAAAGVAALGSTGTAFAGPSQTVKAVTHTSEHPDTTDSANTCAPASDQGPVWAFDNLSLKFIVTPGTAANTYSVKITANGSFDEVADPTTGVCTTGHGSVNGWVVYAVTSATSPNPANLPAQEPGAVTQHEMVNQLFGGNAQVTGGPYSYTYNRIDGGKYTQTG